MKFANGFVLSMMFLFCLSATAETGQEVCESISFTSVREQCLSLIRDRYYDRDAGYVCFRAKFNNNKFDCVRVSIDKDYTANEAYICDEYRSDDDRISCMRSSGRSRDEDGGPTEKLRMIYGLSSSAIQKLYDGDIDGAIETLQRIKRISASK